MVYSKGDMATYYFVVMSKDGKNMIVGWSDNKELVKVYMNFHKCEYYSVKEYTGKIEEIYKIIDENINDEIRLMNILIKDEKSKSGVKYITIPSTELQSILIKDESENFLYTRINYSTIDKLFPYLKKKYQKALKDIYIKDVIDSVLHNRRNNITKDFMFDELLILTSNFSDHFGI